jgi:hypothetical protein
LIGFEFETWFEFELKTLEKIKGKGNRNSLENKKTHFSPNWPSPAQQGRKRPRRLTGGLHLSAAVSFPRALSLPLSLPLPSGTGVSAPVALDHAPPFCLCLAGPSCQRDESFSLTRPLPLATSWGHPVSSALLANCHGPACTHAEIPSHVACPRTPPLF